MPHDPGRERQKLRHTLRLGYAGRYDWASALLYLSNRAIEGVERVEAGVYHRTIRWDGLAGTLEVAHDEAGGALIATVRGLSARAMRTVAERVTRAFDLNADLRTIGAALARDRLMATLVAQRPAIRVFRGWDPFEVAVRSVVGQQVSVSHARRLNGILVERCGARLPLDERHELRMLFPAAEEVLGASLSAMGMPGARVTALKNVAAAALAHPRLFDRSSSVEETVGRLLAVRGVGEWTAHYIAMRACGEPDAFPASDAGLLRGAGIATGRRPTPRELQARAEAWRPWRAYAAHHLWAVDIAALK